MIIKITCLLIGVACTQAISSDEIESTKTIHYSETDVNIDRVRNDDIKISKRNFHIHATDSQLADTPIDNILAVGKKDEFRVGDLLYLLGDGPKKHRGNNRRNRRKHRNRKPEDGLVEMRVSNNVPAGDTSDNPSTDSSNEPLVIPSNIPLDENAFAKCVAISGKAACRKKNKNNRQRQNSSGRQQNSSERQQNSSARQQNSARRTDPSQKTVQTSQTNTKNRPTPVRPTQTTRKPNTTPRTRKRSGGGSRRRNGRPGRRGFQADVGGGEGGSTLLDSLGNAVGSIVEFGADKVNKVGGWAGTALDVAQDATGALGKKIVHGIIDGPGNSQPGYGVPPSIYYPPQPNFNPYNNISIPYPPNPYNNNNGPSQPNFYPDNNNNGSPQPNFNPYNNNNGPSQPNFYPDNNDRGPSQPNFNPVNNNNGPPQPNFNRENSGPSQPNFNPDNNGQSQPNFNPDNNNNGPPQPNFNPENSGQSQPNFNSDNSGSSEPNFNSDNNDDGSLQEENEDEENAGGQPISDEKDYTNNPGQEDPVITQQENSGEPGKTNGEDNSQVLEKEISNVPGVNENTDSEENTNLGKKDTITVSTQIDQNIPQETHEEVATTSQPILNPPNDENAVETPSVSKDEPVTEEDIPNENANQDTKLENEPLDPRGKSIYCTESNFMDRELWTIPSYCCNNSYGCNFYIDRAAKYYYGQMDKIDSKVRDCWCDHKFYECMTTISSKVHPILRFVDDMCVIKDPKATNGRYKFVNTVSFILYPSYTTDLD